MTKKLWVSSADEDGSFSDAESGNQFDVVSNIEKEIQVRETESQGGRPVVLDDTADPDDSYGVDQKFKLHRTEEDSQGTDRPAKHRVGGV